ncbi:short-chain dehydrogenase reductase sdr [Ilyonectria robusta]
MHNSVGRAIALGLATHGAKIVCCDLQGQANQEGYERDLEKTTAEAIAASGGEAIFVQADISNTQQVEEAFRLVIETFYRLDILINCAGYGASFTLFADESEDLWLKMVAVNTLGTARMSRKAVRQFIEQDYDTNWGSRGRIINISSCAGVFGFPGQVAYSATKASINHMTKVGALDHAKDYINFNCVAPGVVATGMARQNFEDSKIHDVLRRATL